MRTPEAHLLDFTSERDVSCPGCGQNLRDLAGSRCPECGVSLQLTVGTVRRPPLLLMLAIIPLGFSCVALVMLVVSIVMIAQPAPYPWQVIYLVCMGIFNTLLCFLLCRYGRAFLQQSMTRQALLAGLAWAWCMAGLSILWIFRS